MWIYTTRDVYNGRMQCSLASLTNALTRQAGMARRRLSTRLPYADQLVDRDTS
jgi:hypothetical protein